MSYAFAPARWVASKNGDFRYHGPKNKVLWPALWGMSAPRENCAGNAHRLFEGFLGRRSAGGRGHSEQPHFVLQRFTQPDLKRTRIESEFPPGFRITPEVRHTRE